MITQKQKNGKPINNQNPSTLVLRTEDDEDLRASCLSSSSKARREEQARGGRDSGIVKLGLVGETEEEREKLCRAGGRLGDLNITFPLAPPTTAPGSWRGNRQAYLMSWMGLRWSMTVLMVGLSEGSFCRHHWAMSANVRAALMGNRPLRFGSIIRESLQSSARKGQHHLTKFLSSLDRRLSMFFRPVRSSRRTIPKL